MLFSSTDEPIVLSPRIDAALKTSPGAKVLRMIRDRDVSFAKILQLSGPSRTIAATIDRVIDEALAEALDSIAVPNLWAATLGSLSVGFPHAHPVWTPIPVPGLLSLGLSQSVRIHSLPVARCGDMGVVLCPSLDPVVTVKTGSTKVFVNGRRAARVLDVTLHGALITKGVKPALSLAPVLDITRKSLGRYLESRPLREVSESRARMTAWAAKGHEARAKAARATDSGSPDLDLQAARVKASAKGAAASALGQTQRASAAAAQAIADAGAAAFGALSKLMPAAFPSFGVLLPMTNRSVSFGGLPMPSTGLGGRITKLGKRVGGGAGRAIGRRTPRTLRDGWASARLKLRAAGAPWRARISEATPKPLRVLAGHPVDVVTGAVLTDAVDASLRGRWVLPIRRHYSSSWAERSGPLGLGWSLSLDLAIWLEPGLLVHRAPDGRELFYDLPDAPDALAQLVITDPCNGLRIVGGPGGVWSILVVDGDAYSQDGIRRIDLAPIADDPEAELRPGIARARRLYGPEGAEIDLDYDERARLITARQGSRTLGLVWSSDSRTLVGLTLPDTAPLADEAPLRVHNPARAVLPRQELHTRYTFDDAGDLRTITDSLGHRQELTYDAHRLTRETFADGRSFTFSYETRGLDTRCVMTRGDGGIFARTFAYEPDLGRTEIIDSLGARTLIQADARGRVVELTDAMGATTTIGYDAHGRRTLERDPLGRETRYDYDELGRRRSVRLANGSSWSFGHTEEGRLASATDGAGNRWRWRYDPRGRLIETIDPLGAALTYAYDDSSKSVEVLSDASYTSIKSLEVVEFSSAGDLLRKRRPGGSVWDYLYDPRGRCVERIDPLGHRRRYTYDDLDRLIAFDDADGERTLIDRDPVGRPLRICGPGRDTTMTYAPCGRIASVIGDPRFPEGLTCTYDSEARLLRIAHDDLEHTFERDVTGTINAEIDAHGLARSFRRDRCGRVRQVLGPGDAERRYDYDGNDRITAIDYADGSLERFSYGLGGELLRAIREEARPRDQAPRERPAPTPAPAPPSTGLPPLPAPPPSRISLERPFDSSFDDIEAHLFEPLAELPPRVAEDRLRRGVELERDALGRVLGEVITPSAPPHGAARSRWVAIERDRLGRTRRLGADTGPVLEMTFDLLSDRAPTALDLRCDGRRWSLASARDRCGREHLRRAPGGVTVDLEHDACGRTTLQRFTAGAKSFGALLSEGSRELTSARYRWTRRGPVQTSADQPPTPQGKPPEEPNTDAGGRQIRRRHNGATLDLIWDAADRLRRVESDRSPTVYLDYDALGRRIQKSVGERTTTWLWEGDRPLIEEIHEEGVLLTRRTWIFDPAPGRRFSPIAAIVDEHLYCVHCDPLGAPLLVTDTSGEVVWRRPTPQEDLHSEEALWPTQQARRGELAPRGHGGLDPHTAPASAKPSPATLLNPLGFDLPFGFPGHYYDHETGLFYSRHRYYDPKTRRFISPDPSGLRGGLDPTAYVDDPTTMIDPLGLRGYSVVSAPDSLQPDQTPCGAAHTGPLDPEPELASQPPYNAPLPADPTPRLTPDATLGERIYAQLQHLSMTC